MAPEADSSLTELSLSISRGSPVPLHHQLRQLLQDQIERGLAVINRARKELYQILAED